MNRRVLFSLGIVIMALVWMFIGTDSTTAEPVRHYPRYFHDPPRDFNPPLFGDRLGGQQGLVTFFIENREELGLSKEQTAKLKAVRNTYRKESSRIRADLQEAEEQFSDLMQPDEMNLKEIEAASRRIEAMEHALRVAFAKAIAEGKQILTPRQLKKAEELRDRSRYRERS
jgi:Spy/CpxP family protein refolding chaperone